MTMQYGAGNGAGGQGNGQGGGAGGNSPTTLTDQQAADALKTQQQQSANQQGQQQNPNGNGQGNQAVQQTNGVDRTAELEEALTAARDHNKTLMDRLEILAVASLPPDQKERAQALIAEAKKEAEKEIQEASVGERELILDRREIAAEYQSYGLTTDLLKDAKTKGEMEVIALRAKADFLEKGGRPNPSKIPSDNGASSSGGGGTGNGANGATSNQPQRGDRTAALIGERFNQARNS